MHDSTITFAGGALDRAAHLRGDLAEMAKLAAHSDAKAMVLWRGKFLTDTSDDRALAWLDMQNTVLNAATDAPIFLGLINETPRFAYDISPWAPKGLAAPDGSFFDDSQLSHPDLPETLIFIELRAMLADLNPNDAGDAATAKGISEWHKTHKFCANCGAATRVSKSGWQRSCPACNYQHFPRTDPVVIMLVTHGNDVLIGRSPQWPKNMYSLLAGFMEPGETIFEAVRREVFEETSVQIGAVEYLLDQPWPFPSSLMIGCKATALTRDIKRDEVELEDALWISREKAMASMAGQNPDIIPARKGSIAHHLLDSWLRDT